MNNRTTSSVKNVITAMVVNVINIGINFFSQKVFINLMGIEYLGLNGLFSNILTLLNIAELGIGEAIVFHLYRPIAKNDKEKIKALMSFYKKAYNYIAIIVFGFGLILLPFIERFVGDITIKNVNLKIVYLLFLLQTVSSYVLTYKRSILYASQKNYIINSIHLCYILLYNFLQLFVLFVYKNYYLYLTAKIISQIIENSIINIYVNKKYEFLKNTQNAKIDKEVEKDIFNRLKATFLHKIGAFLVNGTDNILISKMDSVATVGLYSNYYMIINAVTNLFSQVIYSTTASIGNLLTEKNDKKNFEVFNKIRFLNFYIATFTATCILVIIQNFIKVWIGENYIFNIQVVVMLVINYYQLMMRKTYDAFLNAAGICVENRFVPIAESVLNIVFSIIFYKVFGLVGIFMGTFFSGFALWAYSYPKFVYKKVLKKRYINYVKETLTYFCLFICISGLTFLLSKFVQIDSSIANIIISAIIAVIIPNVIIYIIYHNSVNYKYFITLIKKIKIFNKRGDNNDKKQTI